MGFKGGSKLGVAEWELKINQPSLFQFVRKQKRKRNYIKKKKGKGKGREEDLKKKKKAQRRRRRSENRLTPKMQGAAGKGKDLVPQKAKAIGELVCCGSVCLNPLPQQHSSLPCPGWASLLPPPTPAPAPTPAETGASTLALPSGWG